MNKIPIKKAIDSGAVFEMDYTYNKILPAKLLIRFTGFRFVNYSEIDSIEKIKCEIGNGRLCLLYLEIINIGKKSFAKSNLDNHFFLCNITGDTFCTIYDSHLNTMSKFSIDTGLFDRNSEVIIRPKFKSKYVLLFFVDNTFENNYYIYAHKSIIFKRQ